MKGMNSRLAMIPMAMAAGLLAVSAAAAQQAVQPVVSPAPAVQQPSDQREIVVSLEDRKLALIENGEVKKLYTVAVGKPSTPSPEGTFTIRRRVANPTYQHDGKTVPPGPQNPVGTRWMGLSKAGYGIHGTNEPRSIGKAASHGCIRMAQADLEEFYKLVAVGDTVRLIGHRDQETARLFGAPEPLPVAAGAAAEQPAQTAQSDPTPVSPAVSEPVPATATPTTSTLVSLGTR